MRRHQCPQALDRGEQARLEVMSVMGHQEVDGGHCDIAVRTLQIRRDLLHKTGFAHAATPPQPSVANVEHVAHQLGAFGLAIAVRGAGGDAEGEEVRSIRHGGQGYPNIETSGTQL